MERPGEVTVPTTPTAAGPGVETLRQRLAGRGRLPWPEAVAIATEVAAVLAADHDRAPPLVRARDRALAPSTSGSPRAASP
ncbi:MAG: hypothetical protein HS111_04175 [Kofleriaceae bacterium]|nr:hypothetical protein [Kofleriaceae bacterium]